MYEPTEEDLEKMLDENDIVIIDFYATWCGPCKAYSPKFERVAREVRRMFPDKRIAFAKVDIDQRQSLARAARVMSVPTTVAFRRGKTLFGKPARKETARFAGDRSWPDLVRTMEGIVERASG